MAEKKKTKQAVAAAKKEESKKFADQLEQKKLAALKRLFGMTKYSKKNKDIVLISCSEDGNIKLSLKDKLEIWKEYEVKLLNEENDWIGDLLLISNPHVIF